MEIGSKKKMAVREIAKKYQLKLVLVFGSFASGKSREDSDLDVAVLGSENISFRQQIDLTAELSSLFGRDVDLSVLNAANPLLLFQVSKNAVLLSGSREDFAKFRLYAFRRYNDYAPYFEMESRFNKKLIKDYACR